MIKVFLLYPDRDLDPSEEGLPNAADLIQDLGLDTVVAAMAQGDKFMADIVRRVLLNPLSDIALITYRQEILKDCLAHPDVIRELYGIAVEFLEKKREQWLWFSPRSSPSSVLVGGRNLLQVSLNLFRRLRRISDEYADRFASRGFQRFFTMIQRELDDEYLAGIEDHVQTLEFPGGVTLRAQLGRGNEGEHYLLCRPTDQPRRWFERFFSSQGQVYSFSLDPRDDVGARVLAKLRDRGLARVATAVAHAAAHIDSFFNVLRSELAFYLGCMNLNEQLEKIGEPLTFPQPAPADATLFSAVGLYDVSLALTTGKKVIANDVHADGKELLIVTGPNRGGKTTFLRSVGLAQLMMQAGMFVPAASLTASLCSGVFTHFRREEDKAMESGKLEEELKRLSAVVDWIRPHGLVLLNESFGSTNEREGSEIARQVVSAFLEANVRVIFVTFLHEFARTFHEADSDRVLFLRAERLPDGTRTFRVKEGAPEETSYGADLYRQIFNAERGPTPAEQKEEVPQ